MKTKLTDTCEGSSYLKSVSKKLVLLIVLATIFSMGIKVEAATDESEEVALYEVKAKEDLLVLNKEVINFFEKKTITPFRVAKLKEERKAKEEQERLERERIERERLEQERLERERIARQQQLASYNNPSIASDVGVVNYALQFVGNPYVMGGNSLTNGTDCSGFVMLIYQHYGISLPRTTTGQAQSGVAVSIDNIAPGDIISYGYNGSPSHSALYIGNGMVVHASTPQLGIRTDTMYMMPIITIRRVM